MPKLHRTSLFFLLSIVALFTTLTACSPHVENDTARDTKQARIALESEATHADAASEEETNEVAVHSEANSQRKAQNEPLILVSLGDSLTEGIGDETEQGGYVALLEEKLTEQNFVVLTENFGKKGQRTNQLLKQLTKPKVREAIEKAHIITITIGANDLMHALKESILQKDIGKFHTFQETYAENLTAISKELGALNPHAQVYFIGIYNPLQQLYPQLSEMDFLLNRWNNLTKTSVAALESAIFVPIDDLFSNGNTEYLAEDYFHPNYAGYKKITEKLLPYIEKQLNKYAPER